VSSKDNFEFAHQHRREVAWMSQNTNTLPIHPDILEAIRRSVEEREFNLYPRKGGVPGLADAIREDLGLEGYDVLLTNGGIEGAYIATRTFLAPGNSVVSTDPSFLPIHEQVAMAGAMTIEVDIYREPYVLTPEQVEEAVTPATRMVLLIDPNNPLGSGYTREQVLGVADVARKHDLWLLNDVTYRDFHKEQVLGVAFYPEQTLTSYSFSKGPGLAGMRIGAILAPPGGNPRYGIPDPTGVVMKMLRKMDTNVLGVNVLAQRAALAALQSKKEWLPQVLRICERNQATIRGAVAKVDGASLPVYPSKANMLVIDLSRTGVNPEAVEERLLFDHLVHTRAGSYLSRKHGDEFLRVSFSVPESDCKRFAQAFPAVMEQLRK
jgi:aspartate/methionine/tyrosine aminotransferase